METMRGRPPSAADAIDLRIDAMTALDRALRRIRDIDRDLRLERDLLKAQNVRQSNTR